MQSTKQSSPKWSVTRIVKLSWVLVCMLFIAACHLDMYDQPKNLPYTQNELLPNNAEAQPPVDNTVARNANLDTRVTTGKDGDAFLTEIPITVTDEVLARGKERFQIVCATCHGANGDVKGVAVAGYFKPAPASLYLAHIRTAPDGYLFNVITYGKGQMFPQAQQLTAEDRWAVIAYIRELQKNPPEGVVADPTDVPNPTARPEGTVQPNEPTLP